MDSEARRREIEDAARRRYASIEVIWREDDPWHTHTHRRIHAFVQELRASFPVSSTPAVLNVGSAGQDYGFFPDHQVHVDLVDKFIRDLPRFVVASAENLPFPDNSFDCTLCVGSVLNYCSALDALQEMHRVTRPDGLMVFEYETTSSFEYICRPAYNKPVEVVETFYQGQKERIWVYSDRYIRGILSSLGIREERRGRIHILSPLHYRLRGVESIAARWGCFDAIAAWLPWIGKHASNVILCGRKGATRR